MGSELKPDWYSDGFEIKSVPFDHNGFEAVPLYGEATVKALQEKAELLDALQSGEQALLPQTVEHARNLYIVAAGCLKSYGEDVEAPHHPSRNDVLEEAAREAERRQQHCVDQMVEENTAYWQGAASSAAIIATNLRALKDRDG